MNKTIVSVLVVVGVIMTATFVWSQTFRTNTYHNLVGLVGLNGNQTDVSSNGNVEVTTIEIKDSDGHTLDITSNGEIKCQ